MIVPASRSPFWSVLLAAIGLAALAVPSRATMPPLAGPCPTEVSAAFSAGTFSVPPRPAQLGVSASQTVWRIPVILVSYTDEALAYGPGDFDPALFDTTHATATGSVYDYYKWASGNRISVLGHVVAVVQLPHDKLYYGQNSWGLSRTGSPHNAAGLVRDALLACSAQVNWTEFDVDRDGFVDMLWVVHAGIGGEASPNRYDNDLWSITSRLAGSWSNIDVFETDELVPGSTTQHIRVDRFSMLPELSSFVLGQRSEIGVYCHEFGHALGLPDLYDTRDGGILNVGPGNWTLMSTGAYGGDGHSPEYPVHPGAWPALFLGWTQSIRPASDGPVVLPPAGSGSQVLDLSFQGEDIPEHFLVEARRREGFDRNLPADGVVVYHLDDAVIGQGIQSNTVNSGLTPGLVVVEADGHSDLTTGGNRADAGDVYPGATYRTSLTDDTPPPSTRTFEGNPTNVGLHEIRSVPQGMSFTAQVQAPGWQVVTDQTHGEYAPADAQTPARTVVVTPAQIGYAVASEMRSGHGQIVLRTRRDGAWDAGVQVSNSSGDAFEPAVALLGDDDLAVAWSDTRSGGARIYYRARVGGAWIPEQVLSSTPGESRAPSIGADGRGGVHVAWVFVGQDLPAIEYLRFPYLSPFGQPFPVTETGALPSNPLVAPMPAGGAVVIWSDARTWPPALWFSRCGPDSLPDAPKRLTRPTGASETWVTAVVDPDGTMSSAWIESGSTTCDLCYQVRGPGSGAPVDTTLETSASTIAKPRLARDTGGGVHLVFERLVGGLTQIRYRRRHPSLGWDAYSTNVTALSDGSCIQPEVLPSSPQNVIVTFRGFQGSTPRFMERVRLSDEFGALSVPLDFLPAPARIAIRPNPVRAGQAVELRLGADSPTGLSGRLPGALEVFDLAGRRVATVDLALQASFLVGRLGASQTQGLAAGLYFVRARGLTASSQRLVVIR